MDEARVGQKGRTGHRWWIRGQRPPGLCDKRFASAYIFAAVRPATGEDFALVLPRVCTQAMDRFLADFAAALPSDTHAVLVLDGAGWHDPRAVTLPPNLTLVADALRRLIRRSPPRLISGGGSEPVRGLACPAIRRDQVVSRMAVREEKLGNELRGIPRVTQACYTRRIQGLAKALI
ncbi:hypothetical protein M446_1477 [Methylobacterium sp. 4-46]|uniref:transposase n=1 Tax=unclassified Methylobacterium TaxID=2615210 RepID=UPI000165C825|nr:MULTISPECIES: transposase [Methylobacterium]ACA15982.1 hypothetical protein M446_1477 [Methylobacterium sp. 4-46]WFT81699.1 transposase [Methylobacterium nodulans]